jgi:hypothetical protein
LHIICYKPLNRYLSVLELDDFVTLGLLTPQEVEILVR